MFVSAPQVARAQVNQFSFTRIAETLNNFSTPAIDDGHVAFWATGPSGRQGIYTGRIGGPFNLVVDDATPVPGTTIPLESFGTEFGFEAGRVAFVGFNDDVRGVYLYDNGTINRIADTNTPVPSATGNFHLFTWPPSVNDGKVAFAAQRSTTPGVPPLRGLYLAGDDGLTRIADTTTPVPGGGGPFSNSFDSPVIDSAKVAFIGNWTHPVGIYLHDLDTGAQSRVVDESTPLPGRTETFWGFPTSGHGVDMDGDMIGFIGTAPPVGGVYGFDLATGSLSTIADTDTIVPGGGSAKFEQYFTAVSVDKGAIAFGYGTGFFHAPPAIEPDETEFFGVYSNLGGSLARVLDKGDMLDGKLVSRARIGPGGLDGNQIAMSVDFADGSNAIYVATPIPEPATVALIIPAFGLLAIWVRAARNRKVRD
jgi:hypothetical protein